MREAVEILVGDAPPVVDGEPLYLVRDTHDGQPIWWVSQDVLAHWTPDRDRGSPLTLDGAEGLAYAWGGSVEPL